MIDATTETGYEEERAEIEEAIARVESEGLRETLRRIVTWVHQRESDAHAKLRRELSDLEGRVDRLERDWERDDEKIV